MNWWLKTLFCSDILAPTQIAIKIREFLLGTPQFLMNVVFIVMEQFSNLIHWLTLSRWRMIVRLLNHPIAEFYQVSIFSPTFIIYVVLGFSEHWMNFPDSDKATIEKDYEYQHCCKDNKGEIREYRKSVIYSTVILWYVPEKAACFNKL